MFPFVYELFYLGGGGGGWDRALLIGAHELDPFLASIPSFLSRTNKILFLSIRKHQPHFINQWGYVATAVYYYYTT